jgi:pyruvate dehydrogenase E1 component alpha subunit
VKHRNWLIAEDLAEPATLDAMHAEIEAEMKRAVESAIAAPYPTSDEAEQDVYA